MRIGIFTIYLANYGAVLQSFALRKCILNLMPENQVEVVDFYTHTPYRIIKKESTNPLKSILKNILILRHYFELRRRNSREKSFMQSFMGLSKRVEFDKDFSTNCPNYDIYLTGSDQVLNPNSPYTDVFYQQFTRKNGIKATYASSFGLSDLEKNLPAQYAKLLLDFDYLSCREDDGANFMSKISSKEVPQVIDPTLLLSRKEWEEIAISSDFTGYLLSYNLNGGQSLLDYANTLAKKKNLKHICITQHAEQLFKGPNTFVFDAGPREFVGLFKNADYVVTDSFHGTMFALIFEKPFNTFIAVKSSSRRILSVLEKFNLTANLVTSGGAIQESNVFTLSNNEDFNILKNESLQYLKKVISSK